VRLGAAPRLVLAKGYDGLSIAANAFWLGDHRWQTFVDYEDDVDGILLNKRMIGMCTYALEKSGANEILDVARTHNCALVRRFGEWVFLESTEFDNGNHGTEPRQVRGRNGGLGLLTTREKMVLEHLTRGVTGKEAGRALGISHRTVEFHRTNIMRKLGARNLVELVRIVSEMSY
jgi:DNA-binding NarL/FixJ family response regulator